MKWYVNGALNHTGTGMTRTLGTPVRWFLGSHNGGNGNYWYGKVDELRIYDVELSSFDIESIYREASGSPLDLGEDDYTISTWFKPSANPGYMPGLTA